MSRNVCKVRPDGEIVCDDERSFVIAPLTSEARAAFEQSISTLFPGTWGPNKIDLALRLFTLLGSSPLPDANVGARAKHVLGSVDYLLATVNGTSTPEEPPSILLFDFSTLPAQALGPWVLARRGHAALDALYEQFPGDDPW